MGGIENLPGEVWKDIPGYEGKYKVSNMGRFIYYKNSKSRLVKPLKAKTGALGIKVYLDGKSKTLYQYRTMYKAFINQNVSDDYLILLKDNMHLHIDNLYAVHKSKVNRFTHGKEVYVYDIDSTFLGKYRSAADVAEKFNMTNRSTVSRVCNNKTTHSNFYICSYHKLSNNELITKINNAILSSFNSCHRYKNSGLRSHTTTVDYEYSTSGIISKIKVIRTFHYKLTDTNKTVITEFNPKNWTKHDASYNHTCPKVSGKIPEGGSTINQVKQSRLYSTIAYVYDGNNGKFLFSDSFYNIAIKNNVNFETVRLPIRQQLKNKKNINYSIFNKHPYVLLIERDDALAYNYILNNRPVSYNYDKDILARYNSIKSRCYVKNSSNYKYYGGKGITMFIDWVADYREFEVFMKQLNFTKNLEIDRINPDFGYEPWNIQLLSRKENQIKMNHDLKRSAIQIKMDKLKYLVRKHNFFKSYKKGMFMYDKL